MITITDKSKVSELMDVLDKLNGTRVEVGVLSSEQDSEMVMIASVHEYGVVIDVTPKMRAYLHHIGIHLKKETSQITIPERSYIRTTYDEKQEELYSLIKAYLPQVINLKMTPETFYGRIGAYLVGQIQKKLTDIREPANHPVTVERKGSSNPLIDSGHLRRSITWRVVSG